MVLSHEYSRDYFPSAPVVDIGIRSAPQGSEIEIEALMDTGADATILPLSLLRRINAIYSETVNMRGVTGISQNVQTFVIAVRVGPHVIPAIRAIADKQGNEAILGRDVLIQLRITLDGPALTTEIWE
jgi:predicted aspartyl protease